MAELLGVGSRINHPVHGAGMIVGLEDDFYQIYFYAQQGMKEISISYEHFNVSEKRAEGVMQIDYGKIKDAIDDALIEFIGHNKRTFIAAKWKGGSMRIQAADKSLQDKEIPIDTFFHKIVMLRDKLRVLEQSINSHPKLDDSDRINLQKYITACYGSLTTFNVLFTEKEEQFKGAGSKD